MDSLADHTARRDAALALEKIAAHERTCAERWTEARTEMRGLRAEIRSVGATVSQRNAAIYGRIWWLVGIFITALLLVIGWLISKL